MVKAVHRYPVLRTKQSNSFCCEFETLAAGNYLIHGPAQRDKFLVQIQARLLLSC